MNKRNFLALGDNATLQQLAKQLANQGDHLFLFNPLQITAINWQNHVNLNWQEVDKVIVISTNAAIYGLAKVYPQLTTHCEIFTIGPSTAKQITQFCDKKIIYPKTYNSEHLLEEPHLQQVIKEKIVIFKGVGGRNILEQTLQQRGAIVYTIDCYLRQAINIDLTKQVEIWQNNAVTGLIISSVESLEAFVQLLQPEQLQWLLQLTIIATSKRLEQAAQVKGFQHIACAENFSAEAICNILNRKPYD